jgi:hypothetical protein
MMTPLRRHSISKPVHPLLLALGMLIIVAVLAVGISYHSRHFRVHPLPLPALRR